MHIISKKICLGFAIGLIWSGTWPWNDTNQPPIFYFNLYVLNIYRVQEVAIDVCATQTF